MYFFRRCIAYLCQLAIVSFVYLAAFYATYELWMPLQSWVAPHLGKASLLFLPHGIRVVVAFVFGLRAIFLLLPVTFFSYAIRIGLGGFSSSDLFALCVGSAAAPIVFYLGTRFGFALSIDIRPYRSRQVIVAGMLAALLNASLANLAYGASLKSYIAYATGDFFGQLLCFALMIKVNRLLARYHS